MKQDFYLTVGGRLRRHRHSLVLEHSDPDAPDGPPLRRPVPIEQVEALYALSEVDLNSKLVGLLARHGVLLHFFDYYGNYTATLYPRAGHLSGRLHVLQAAHYLNPKRRLRLARAFVRGALQNMYRVLNYYAHRLLPDTSPRLDEGLTRLMDARRALRTALDVPSLMGIEGSARQAYYRAWNGLPGIGDTDFAFTRRSRRPPADPINALISFGNSLCYALVLQALYRTALDPTLSFLHEPGDRRFSLALDLAELFKPVLVDRTLLSLIRRGQLTSYHFAPRHGGVYLNEAGRRRFLEHWECRLKQTFHHRELGRSVRYDELPLLACHDLIRHLNEPRKHPFRGFRLRW